MSGNYIPKPNNHEIKLSKVACLLDELDGKPFNKDHWCGAHPKIFCKTLPSYDQDGGLEEELFCRVQDRDVTKLSSRMQTWVRDRTIKRELIERMACHISGDYQSMDETADWIMENLNFTFKK